MLTAIVALATFAVCGARGHAAFQRTRDEWLTHIQNYLNLISTVEADFLQTSSNGEFARGRLYIERPGRLRVEYDPPSPLLIIANNGLLIYFDRKLQQTTYVPLDSTPAAILLAPSIHLKGGPLKIVSFRVNDGTVELTVVQKDDPGEGSLTLVFSDPPLTLKQWMVTDAQGISTTVSLQNTRFDIPLKPDLFKFNDPRFGKNG